MHIASKVPVLLIVRLHEGKCECSLPSGQRFCCKNASPVTGVRDCLGNVQRWNCGTTIVISCWKWRNRPWVKTEKGKKRNTVVVCGDSLVWPGKEKFWCFDWMPLIMLRYVKDFIRNVMLSSRRYYLFPKVGSPRKLSLRKVWGRANPISVPGAKQFSFDSAVFVRRLASTHSMAFLVPFLGSVTRQTSRCVSFNALVA